MRVAEAGDCERCEVFLSRPTDDNEIIVELYNLLPPNYDGFSGFRVLTLSDIIQMFDMFGVLQELREDYYRRLVYFHDEMMDARSKWDEIVKDAKGQNDKGGKDMLPKGIDH